MKWLLPPVSHNSVNSNLEDFNISRKSYVGLKQLELHSEMVTLGLFQYCQDFIGSFYKDSLYWNIQD